MSKSAFDRWWEKPNSPSFDMVTDKDDGMCIWLAALKWALRQREKNPIDGKSYAGHKIDPDKIKAEIKKVGGK